MSTMLQRFAEVVIRKIRALVTRYTEDGKHSNETSAEWAARQALAWMLMQAIKAINRFPYLNPVVAARARNDIDALARQLGDWYSPFARGGTATS